MAVQIFADQVKNSVRIGKAVKISCAKPASRPYWKKLPKIIDWFPVSCNFGNEN